jgi:hypothetical protein
MMFGSPVESISLDSLEARAQAANEDVSPAIVILSCPATSNFARSFTRCRGSSIRSLRFKLVPSPDGRDDRRHGVRGGGDTMRGLELPQFGGKGVIPEDFCDPT